MANENNNTLELKNKPIQRTFKATAERGQLSKNSKTVVFLSEGHNDCFSLTREKNGRYVEQLIMFSNNTFMTDDEVLIEDIRNSDYYNKALWEKELPKHIKERQVKNLPKRTDADAFVALEEAEFLS